MRGPLIEASWLTRRSYCTSPPSNTFGSPRWALHAVAICLSACLSVCCLSSSMMSYSAQVQTDQVLTNQTDNIGHQQQLQIIYSRWNMEPHTTYTVVCMHCRNVQMRTLHASMTSHAHAYESCCSLSPGQCCCIVSRSDLRVTNVAWPTLLLVDLVGPV